MLETVVVPPTPRPTGFLWFLRNGSSWHAPSVNNGQPYLPGMSNQLERDFFWFFRNPIGNLMGFVLGFEGSGFTVKGPAPATIVTWRNAPPATGWKWAILNGWAPFVSYWGPTHLGFNVEFYLGWRPNTGGLGFKFIPTTSLS